MPSNDSMCINVCCTTGSVEYPATFLTMMPRFSQAFTSILLIPVPASHTSFTFGAALRRSSVTFTLFTISTSQSLTRSFASSGLDVGHAVSSPHAAIGDSDVSPTVAASRNVIFIKSMFLFLLQRYDFFDNLQLLPSVSHPFKEILQSNIFRPVSHNGFCICAYLCGCPGF